MQLLGSNASPFVRRIRLLLEDKDYEYKQLKVFTEEGQAELKKVTPTRRVPVLIDGSQTFIDSYLITKYLSNKTFDLDYEKDLLLINEGNDAAIHLFQLRFFETDKNWENTFSRNLLRRMEDVLKYFESQDLSQWGIREQWLYCFVDWLSFRDIIKWEEEFQNLANFLKSNESRPYIKETDPRN